MPRYSLAPPRPDYPAAVSVAHLVSGALTYLLLARGTGADNRSSTWSVQAIEKYSNISRGRAAGALRDLQRAGAIQVLREGTRPKYWLTAAHEVPGSEVYLPPLDEEEQGIFDLVRNGPVYGPPTAFAARLLGHCRDCKRITRTLVAKGWLRDLD